MQKLNDKIKKDVKEKEYDKINDRSEILDL